MYAKLKITATLRVLSGLHIGGGSAFSAIGAVDNEVIKDPLTDMPLIPGSSLKGKMRSLLAKAFNQSMVRSPDADDIRVRRLFGCGSSEGRALPSRLIFSDSVLGKSPSPLDEYSRAVEIKSENTISRLTAIANPRQMERVIRNSCFNVDILYEISHAVDDYLTETAEDLETLGTGFRLLSLDYLGGSGSRGYGRVAFENFSVEVCYGSVAPEELQLWRESFIAATGTVPAEENGA